MDPVESTGAHVLPVVDQLVRLLPQTGTSDGLTPVPTAVLGRVSWNGAQPLTDPARSQGASQPGMTQLVRRMEHDGLVRRGRDPHDGRGVQVAVTDVGREVFGRVEAEYSAVLDALLNRLDEADREVIGAALPALGRLVGAAVEPRASVGSGDGAGPAPGPRLVAARRPA